MMFSHKIPNTNLRFIRSHKSLNLLGAVGQKAAIFLTVKQDSFVCQQHFVDENINEMFTCLDFLDYNNMTYAIIGGSNGIIKIIEVDTGRFYGYISAHFDTITDIKVSDVFITTASDDCSIKIWDFRNFSCIKAFSGVHGHSDAALTVEIDLKRKTLLTTGLDCKILEWKIDDKDHNSIYKPLSCTENVHKTQILKCQYFDKLIITLSADNRLSIIKPTRIKPPKKEEFPTNYKEIAKSLVNGLYDRSKDFKITKNNINAYLNLKSSHYIETEKIKPKVVIIKEISLGDVIIIDIKVHRKKLFCLTKKSGIYIIKLETLFDNTYTIKTIPEIQSEAICMELKDDLLFALYEDGTILGIKYK